MAGTLRRAAVYFGLAEDGRPAEDEYAEYEEYTETGEAREPGAGETRGDGRRGATASSVAYLPDRRPQASAGESVLSRITTIHPTTYNEARVIGEHYRDGVPVIMNLTNLDDGDAKRLVDFAAGLVFGRHGTIEKVTSKVFLLSPAEVTVTAEDKARIAGGAFFNQS